MERSPDDGGHPPDEGSRKHVNNGDSEFVEVDPTGRYGRYDEVLGKGAYKTVYKAFDDLEGLEVAWNQVKFHDMVHKGGDMERLYSELHLLKTLKHKNIIKFFNSWIDTRDQNVNFITEIFTSGTLRQYRKKHRHVNIRAIKHWAIQILQGLVYLHSHEPPIIHRDLKCDNIFINGNNGEVKIGDLGLATILRQAPAAHSVIGTPEFMAPELYEENYNELVDIYSFGMCLLEMLTSEYPYSECMNAAQIYKKVTTGKKPAALNKVEDPETRRFVEKCLASASQRLHAKQLLLDPFLQIPDELETSELSPYPMNSHYEDMKELGPAPRELFAKSTFDASLLEPRGISTGNQIFREKLVRADSNVNSLEYLHAFDSPRLKEGWKRSRDFRIKGKKQDDKKVLIRIRITSSTGEVRYIQFDFDVDADTAMSVASEMVTELDLSDQDVTTIADMIDDEIACLIPDWKHGLSLDEPGDHESVSNDQSQLMLDHSNEQHVSLNRGDALDDVLSDNTDVEVAHRNEAPNTYGRFEEVGCGQTGSDLRQEHDGSEFFSDFSSDHHEAGGSDTSVELSLDRASIPSMTQNLEGIGIDNIPEPSSSVDIKTPEDITNECIHSAESEGDSDSDEYADVDPDLFKSLILQQEKELQLLRSKHERALLDLKTKRRKASLRENSSSRSSEMPSENVDSKAAERPVEGSNLNDTTTIIVNMSKSETLTSVQANNVSVHAASSLLTTTHTGYSGITSAANLLRHEREDGTPGKKDTHDGKSSVILSRRESYLEYYKGHSNHRENKLVNSKSPESRGTADELRKQQLQKSIADLEARTLEGLLQSKPKYSRAAVSRSNSNAPLQNGQVSTSGTYGKQQLTPETTKS